jgi:hypothetical protein
MEFTTWQQKSEIVLNGPAPTDIHYCNLLSTNIVDTMLIQVVQQNLSPGCRLLFEEALEGGVIQ